jgi:hypothetical protein
MLGFVRKKNGKGGEKGIGLFATHSDLYCKQLSKKSV